MSFQYIFTSERPSPVGNDCRAMVRCAPSAFLCAWYQYFTVCTVASHLDASLLQVAGNNVAPCSCHLLLVIGIFVDIEETAGSLAAAQHHAAIGQFLAFGLVATRARQGGLASQCMPGLAEVVGVEHTVAMVLCPNGSIYTIVCAHLDGLALRQFAATHEKTLHAVLVKTLLATLHECTIEHVGYVRP